MKRQVTSLVTNQREVKINSLASTFSNLELFQQTLNGIGLTGAINDEALNSSSLKTIVNTDTGGVRRPDQLMEKL